jgi:glycosyltransferase involved in cell wall biosynthesis
MKKQAIRILSATNTLVPRVRFEKSTLEMQGYSVQVSYRNRVFWSWKTFRGLGIYYVQALTDCLKKDIRAVHMTHIIHIPMSPMLRLAGKVVVYDAYERYSVDISELHFRRRLRKPMRLLIEFLENFFVRFFINAVFVVSTPREYLLERYRKYCAMSYVLYNVPSVSYTFEDGLEQKFTKERLKIAYVGGVSAKKGCDKLVDIAGILYRKKLDFEFHLIGPFDSEAEQLSIVKEIEMLSLFDKVLLHGYMEFDAMMELLYNCHMGLNLTPKTPRLDLVGIGSSRKNYTYMSAGMVVITTDVGEMAEVTRKENCGIVLKDSADPYHIADIIEGLAVDLSMATRMARNGVKAIKEKYNWEKEENKVIAVYDRLFEKYL